MRNENNKEPFVLKNGGAPITIDFIKWKTANQILHAVNHPLRKKILSSLLEQQSMTVSEIYTNVRVEQSIASQHLAALRKAGVVVAERNGKFIHYSIHREQIQRISNMVKQIASAPAST